MLHEEEGYSKNYLQSNPHQNGRWLARSNVTLILVLRWAPFGSNGMIVSMSSPTSYVLGAILIDLGRVSATSVLQGMTVIFEGVFATPVSSISQVLKVPWANQLRPTPDFRGP
ncbi:MAG: hypothetical protein JRN15_06290 [Nitrososphaerota archaeon]|nr:hypothetical protein [Nitrososphaerota archaeon]